MPPKSARQRSGGNEGATLAACFAHVRRRFYELHVNESSQLATQTVMMMAALWKVEEDVLANILSNTGEGPTGKVRRHCGKPVRAVGNAATTALVLEIQTRLGDPLCQNQAERSLMLPYPWGDRNRFQHC